MSKLETGNFWVENGFSGRRFDEVITSLNRHVEDAFNRRSGMASLP